MQLAQRWQSLAAEAFDRKIRNCCTDNLRTNFTCEDAVCQTIGWVGFHIGCLAHMMAICHTYVSTLMADDRKGCIDYIKALRANGEMDKFRVSSRKAFFKKLRVIRHRIVLSPEALAFNQLVIAVFFESRDEHFHTIEALNRLAVGDWRDPEHFDYVALETETREDIEQLLEDELLHKLIGREPFRYPLAKWSGHEQSFRDVGLAGCMNNMAADAVKEYMHDFHGMEQIQPVARSVGPLLAALQDRQDETPMAAAGEQNSTDMTAQNRARRGEPKSG